jgi:glycosyltransferase involved in cell wall biosynthesis
MHAKQRVAICIPSGESWMAPMAFQATCLAIHSAAFVNVIPLNIRGDDTAQARNRLVRYALQAGAEWLLWIDADMVFPPDALMQLLGHGVDIIGADYRRRAPPFDRIGVPVPGIHSKDERRDEMLMLGLGLFLTRASVFNTLPSPWFGRTWRKEHATPDNPDGFSTEDTYFCGVARHYGYRIWCDVDLTAQVQHVGEAIVPWRLPGAPDGPGSEIRQEAAE